MDIDWGEADPSHFLGRIAGWTVAINDADVEVLAVDRQGVAVRDDGGERRVEWDAVETLFIY